MSAAPTPHLRDARGARRRFPTPPLRETAAATTRARGTAPCPNEASGTARTQGP
jgi:hypothetical protein